MPPAVLVGVGDDAAVVGCPDGRVVATTDALVEGRHFRFDWSTPYDVGRKAAAANLADIAAMGATGTALLVSLVAPPDLPVTVAEGIVDGLSDEAASVGAAVVGGDTVAGERLMLAVTALGDLAGRRPVLRSAAQVGDAVVLAGRLGWSYAGWRLLTAGRRDGPLVEAHRRPQPPYATGPLLAAAGATAMCDVSDGLIADLGHIAKASGVRILLDVEALLAGARAEAPELTVEDVLGGGEDHALVAALPAGGAVPAGCRVIGTVAGTQPEGSVVAADGQPLSVPGWDHFSAKEAP